MMKKQILFFTWWIIAGYVCIPRTAMSAEPVYAIIKSASLEQMDHVIAGFSESLPGASMRILNLEGRSNTRKIREFLQKEQPSLIICLGMLATTSTLTVEKTRPVLFAMTLDHFRFSESPQENVTGISMEIPPESLFTQFRILAPDIRAIGVPHHPAMPHAYIENAARAAKRLGITLISIEITSPREMLRALKRSALPFDSLWMVPDAKLYNQTTQTLPKLIKFSATNKKPLLAFSESFLKAGALFSISIDYRSLGSQLALLSRRILEDHVSPKDIPPMPPIGTFTVLNTDVARTLWGDGFDETEYEVDKFYPETTD